MLKKQSASKKLTISYLVEHPEQSRSRYLRQTLWRRRMRLFQNNLSVWGGHFRQPPSTPEDRPDWHRGIGSLRLWNTMGGGERKKQIVWLKSCRKKLLLFLFECKSESDSLLLLHTLSHSHSHTRTLTHTL